MFKKPIKADVTITHELKAEDKEYIDQKIEAVKGIFKETLIFLAIGIPCAILFGVTANVIGDIVTENHASSEQ